MKGPVHCLFLLAACLWLSAGMTAQAEPPAAETDAGAKPVVIPRSKPQVIYHLPRSASYPAALHSQAKSRNDLLPIDPGMPTSLQLSRSAANAAALQAEAEAAKTENPAPEPSVAPRPKRVLKRPPAKGPRVHVFAPHRGHGNPHPGKGRRK